MAFESDGYCWVRQGISSGDIKALCSIFTSTNNQRLELNAQSQEFIEAISNLSGSINSILPNSRPVRIVAFNKSRDENWSLPWHQDRVISVYQRETVNGYSNWSRKAGLWHCEPPVNILNNMLAIRIHLDDADDKTGALEILKGSHKFGKVKADDMAGVESQCKPITCQAKTGDILVMKMLVIHRSKPSMSDAPRRAIRIDYSADDLPAPLGWDIDKTERG